MSYIDQTLAKKIDEDLMSTFGFSIDQLMEMAGYSCACSILKEYSNKEFGRILVICGPGNNGGDGLVAARHLSHFGYKPSVFYPKRSSNALYSRLLAQNEFMDIKCIDQCPSLEELENNYDLVLDAIFGFSFHGSPRAPFDSVINLLNSCNKPIVCVDIPSGWDVNDGDVHECAIHNPDMLISLTAPKLGSKHFKGRFHYLGGRFLPPRYAQEKHIELFSYPGCEQCVRLS